MKVYKIDGKNINISILQEQKTSDPDSEYCIQIRINKNLLNTFFVNFFLMNGHKKNEKISLTRREKQVLEYISAGINNAQIAQKLHVSVHTTKVHIHNIFNKLYAQDRTEAVVKAIKYGLIDFPEENYNNDRVSEKI